MLTVKQLFQADVLEMAENKIKLVKRVDPTTAQTNRLWPTGISTSISKSSPAGVTIPGL